MIWRRFFVNYAYARQTELHGPLKFRETRKRALCSRQIDNSAKYTRMLRAASLPPYDFHNWMKLEDMSIWRAQKATNVYLCRSQLAFDFIYIVPYLKRFNEKMLEPYYLRIAQLEIIYDGAFSLVTRDFHCETLSFIKRTGKYRERNAL